jgi:hypothetical protein
MVRSEGKKSYEYIRIVKRENKPSLAVVFYSDAEYIKNILKTIWLGNFVRWFIQALVISIVTLLVIRWGILRPLNRIVEWVKAARFGNVDQIQKHPPINFLAPLYKEILALPRPCRKQERSHRRKQN